ncbi:Predicted arabinose efflux permease, MFS family [Agrococcus baldri]|uniref:Predicted arabinose efflux permease, MFS family n=1 Tax=Agrococcus baldri TaxID=153730 RepID=A0AA94KYL6_9MICO|nr:MFS transporter [Agrococcus baldri]SFR99846.1 Predicted arabinose efflux permease, MFS family [Agrococcus baldri]
MRAYSEVLKVPGLARIIFSQLIARFPAGMMSLGILMHMEHLHGSYSAAGLVLAAFSVGMATAGPFITRLLSRFGTLTVLLVTAAISAGALLLLATQAVPLWVDLLAGIVAGAATPPVTPTVRTLYPRMVPQRLLSPLFSFDAALQEIIWVFGPVLVVSLVALAGTGVTLLVTIAIQFFGAVLFILNLEVRRLRIPPTTRKLGRVLRKPPVLLSVVISAMFIGGFSAVEAGVVGTFGEGALEAGIVLAVSAIGSLVGGFAIGSRGIAPWSVAIRLTVVLAGMVIALPMTEVFGLSIALFIAGLGTAPALAAFSAIIAGTVKFADTPEAYAWIGTGQLLGAAVGSALAGVCIDAVGGVGGVWVGAVMVAIAAAIAAIFRRHQPDLRHGIGDPPDTAPIELPR